MVFVAFLSEFLEFDTVIGLVKIVLLEADQAVDCAVFSAFLFFGPYMDASN